MFNCILNKDTFFHFEHVCPFSWNTKLISFLPFDTSAFDSDVTYNIISILADVANAPWISAYMIYICETYRFSESNAAACYFRMHWPSWDTEERLNSERWKLTFLYLLYDSTLKIANVIELTYQMSQCEIVSHFKQVSY